MQDGNPLLLEPWSHTVRDAGPTFAAEQLPTDPQAILNARLFALGPEGARVLGLCAVFGHGFPHAALASFWQGERAGEVERWIAYLSERDLLHPRTLGARDESMIRHAMIRDLAYAALPLDERQRGHRLAATWFEARRSFDLAALAYHHEAAGNGERAHTIAVAWRCVVSLHLGARVARVVVQAGLGAHGHLRIKPARLGGAGGAGQRGRCACATQVLLLHVRLSIMKITSKGQVTIPVEVRETLGLLPNTEVEFVVHGETVRLVKKPAKGARGRGADALSRLRGAANVSMTTNQILALTRKPR